MPRRVKALGERELGTTSKTNRREDTHESKPAYSFSLRIGDLFADRYEVRDYLGSGTFGEVYSAFDRSPLQRGVALKVIRDAWTGEASEGALGRERFLREARIAGNFSHTRIATVYDTGDCQGRVYITQELVQGRDLRDLVDNEGPLPLGRALGIIVQVCNALSYAHSKGITHRDVKPGNILVDDRFHVKITDFGLAGATHPDKPMDESTLPGVLAGTPGYMAPEQIRCESLDARADVFAVGCVLYKILTGHHPFEAETTSEVIEKSLHASPLPPSRLVHSLPEAIDRICLRAIRKDRHGRYETVAEMARDLLDCLRASQGHLEPYGGYPDTFGLEDMGSELAPMGRMGRLPGKLKGPIPLAGAAVAILAVILLGSPSLRWRVERALGVSTVPAVRQVAVVPFTIVGGDPQVRAFADGLTDTVAAKLSQLGLHHPLQVVPVSELRRQHVSTAADARKEFGVNLVITGTLQRSSGMVRVTAILIDAVGDRQLAGDALDARDSDPFVVEDRVVSSVLAMLEVAPGSGERRSLSVRGTTHPLAYDYYLQGRGYLQEYEKPQSIDSAILVFKRALGEDQNFAAAYAGLGEAYWHKYTLSHDSDWVQQAKSACDRAVQIQPSLAGGHACLGLLDNGTGQHQRAVDEFTSALKLDPSDSEIYAGLAASYEALGRLKEAESTYRQAISLHPQYWGGYSKLGAFYYGQGRLQEAADAFAQVTALAPDNARGYTNLGAIYVALGRYADAIPQFQRSIALQPTASAYSNLGTTYFQLRRFSDASGAFEKASKLDELNYLTWGNLADAEYLSEDGRQRSRAASEKAIVLAKRELSVNPRDSSVMANLADYYSMLGQREDAIGFLKQALALAPADSAVMSRAAEVYNQLGDTEQAIRWIQKAVAAGYSATMVRDTPALDNLRSDPRVRELLASK